MMLKTLDSAEVRPPASYSKPRRPALAGSHVNTAFSFSLMYSSVNCAPLKFPQSAKGPQQKPQILVQVGYWLQYGYLMASHF